MIGRDDLKDKRYSIFKDIFDLCEEYEGLHFGDARFVSSESVHLEHGDVTSIIESVSKELGFPPFTWITGADYAEALDVGDINESDVPERHIFIDLKSFNINF
jgi:hypothetical protein